MEDRKQCSQVQKNPSGHLINTSKDYIDNHVNEELHPGLSESGFEFSEEEDRFSVTEELTDDVKSLSDCQKAFEKAMEEYQEQVALKHRVAINVQALHNWDEVIESAEVARRQYDGTSDGVAKKGILKKIRFGFRSFSTAAPAIEAWLKFLPSDSIYGSVLCGGISLILGAAVRLGQLREDTFDALDQIPLRVERAEMFVRTYHGKVKAAANLYRAILETLNHILSWYKRKAGLKFFESVFKGPAYARELKSRMKSVEEASEALNDEANMKIHQRLKEIRVVAKTNRSHLVNVEKRTDELKILALEARNNLYNMFKDTDLLREVVQGAVASKEPTNGYKRDSRGKPSALQQRHALLLELGHDPAILMRDFEEALRQLHTFHSCDRDRVAAILENVDVAHWITGVNSQALVVNGNCRRDERLAPTSAATALLVHVLSNTTPVVALYWFCGSANHGQNGNAFGMIRSLISQLLGLPFSFEIGYRQDFDSENIEDLLDMFQHLLRQLPIGTAVICAIDGISFYEGLQQREDMYKAIRTIAKAVKIEQIIFKLLATSPKRTNRLLTEDPKTAKRIDVVEIPHHIEGSRQGFNGLFASTERRARRLSANLEAEGMAM